MEEVSTCVSVCLSAYVTLKRPSKSGHFELSGASPLARLITRQHYELRLEMTRIQIFTQGEVSKRCVEKKFIFYFFWVEAENL